MVTIIKYVGGHYITIDDAEVLHDEGGWTLRLKMVPAYRIATSINWVAIPAIYIRKTTEELDTFEVCKAVKTLEKKILDREVRLNNLITKCGG